MLQDHWITPSVFIPDPATTIAAEASSLDACAHILATCDRQFPAQFAEITQWLAKREGSLGHTLKTA